MNYDKYKLIKSFIATARKRVVPAVFSALFLGSMLAVVEAIVLALGVGFILSLMGVSMVNKLYVVMIQMTHSSRLQYMFLSYSLTGFTNEDPGNQISCA